MGGIPWRLPHHPPALGRILTFLPVLTAKGCSTQVDCTSSCWNQVNKWLLLQNMQHSSPGFDCINIDGSLWNLILTRSCSLTAAQTQFLLIPVIKPFLDLTLITQVLLIDCCSYPVPAHPCDQALPWILCCSHRSCSLTAAQTQFLLIPVIKPFPGSHAHHTGPAHWLLLKPNSCSSLWSSPSLDLMLITQVLLIDCCSNPVPAHPCDQALPWISHSSHRSCSLTATLIALADGRNSLDTTSLSPSTGETPHFYTSAYCQRLFYKPFPGSHTHHTGPAHWLLLKPSSCSSLWSSPSLDLTLITQV